MDDIASLIDVLTRQHKEQLDEQPRQYREQIDQQAKQHEEQMDKMKDKMKNLIEAARDGARESSTPIISVETGAARGALAPPLFAWHAFKMMRISRYV